MLKIICNNGVCGASFFFNEEKNPNAKKVMCPKCKSVQPLQGAPTPKEDDLDWLKSDDGPRVAAAPVMRQTFEIQPQYQNNEFEDFSAPKETKKAPVTQPQRKPPKAAGMREDELGWLIIHDENTESYTFDLRKGINRIGRFTNTTPPDINIRIKTEDRYMSRHHCDIEARWKSGKNAYEYVLTDRGSSNGTFVNAGRRLSVRDEIPLNDGDTIQVGRTKLVLKLPSAVGNLQEAESWVRETDFFKTIIQ